MYTCQRRMGVGWSTMILMHGKWTQLPEIVRLDKSLDSFCLQETHLACGHTIAESKIWKMIYQEYFNQKQLVLLY